MGIKIEDIISNHSIVEIYQMVLSGELEKFPTGIWKDDNAMEYSAECIRYLVNNVLNFSHDEVTNKLSISMIKKYRLSTVVNKLFNSRLYDCIDNAFPGEYKPWEFKRLLYNYWTEDKAIEAVRWLLEEKLGWGHDEVCEKFDRHVLEAHNLRGIQQMIGIGTFELLNLAYPGEYMEWELCTLDKWTDDMAIRAVRWLFEGRLKVEIDDIPKIANGKLFRENGLRGLLRRTNSSYIPIIDMAYPNKFKPWDFNLVPRGIGQMKIQLRLLGMS